MSKLSRLFTALLKDQQRYESSVSGLENQLNDKVLFEFSIGFIPGDGFVILNEETTGVASLLSCLRIIETDGYIREDEHEKLCI